MRAQIVRCENCGSEWRIELYCENVEIDAELVKCPLCKVKGE